MEKIVLFGKGGIGKSTIASNLAVAYARQGLRVLLVGCDPKHDTTLSLTRGVPIKTVLQLPGFMNLADQSGEFIVRGAHGIDCVEAGGPEPGIGCAGRGISRLVEIFEARGVLTGGRYDVALFDVLGDVVCGGFAAPLRMGFADKVCIVASEELMALYAANNIARAIENNADNRISLCGLIVNLRDPGADRAVIERFARLIGTRVLSFLPRDPAVRRAEFSARPVLETSPKSPFAREAARLAERVLRSDAAMRRIPSPLPDDNFSSLALRGFKGARRAAMRKPVPAAETPAAPADERAPGGPRPGKDVFSGPGPSADAGLLEAFRSRYGAPGPKWENIPCSLQWNTPGQWRNFLCELEEARNFQEQFYIYAPMLGVRHEDIECHFSTSHLNDGLLYFFNFPWFSGRLTEDRYHPLGGSISTNLGEKEVVFGSAGKLEAVVEDALRAMPRKVPVFVNSSCLPTVLGDASEASLKKIAAKHGVDLLYSNPAAQQEFDPVRDCFVAAIDKLKTRTMGKEKTKVNLVGFPENESRGELVALLGELGLRVNTPLIPRVDPSSAADFVRAGLTVLYPEPGFAPAYAALAPVFERWGMKTISPAAPYGLRGTARWLEEVCAHAGVAKPILRSLKEELARRVRRSLQEEAAAPAGRLGFVLDGYSVQRLCGPAGFHGVPLLNLLKELGFELDLLVYSDGRSARAEVRNPRYRLRWFKTPGELRTLLKEPGVGAFYSEFFFDKRLTSAGKAQFSLKDVELGIEGALRTARRLRKLCGWSFYSDYRKHLQGR